MRNQICSNIIHLESVSEETVPAQKHEICKNITAVRVCMLCVCFLLSPSLLGPGFKFVWRNLLYVFCVFQKDFEVRGGSPLKLEIHVYICVYISMFPSLFSLLIQFQQRGQNYNTLGLVKVVVGKGFASLFLSSSFPSISPCIFLETALAQNVPQLLYYLAVLTVCFLAYTPCVMMLLVRLFQEKCFSRLLIRCTAKTKHLSLEWLNTHPGSTEVVEINAHEVTVLSYGDTKSAASGCRDGLWIVCTLCREGMSQLNETAWESRKYSDLKIRGPG